MLYLFIGCADWLFPKCGAGRKTFKLAFFGQDDTHVTAKQVANTPYASAYLKVGKAPQAFVVLAFAEQNQLKWIRSR
nr:YjbF family lipoprotein [Pectobacterium colocasium]